MGKVPNGSLTQVLAEFMSNNREARSDSRGSHPPADGFPSPAGPATLTAAQGLPFGYVEEEPSKSEPEASQGVYDVPNDNSLTDDQRQKLQEFWDASVASLNRGEPDFKTHTLPLARIKRLMKMDENVKMIGNEAPLLFSRACEIFISELTMRSWFNAEDNKRRTVQRGDTSVAVSKFDQYDFLIDIVPREDLTRNFKKHREDVPTASSAAAAASGLTLPGLDHPEPHAAPMTADSSPAAKPPPPPLPAPSSNALYSSFAGNFDWSFAALGGGTGTSNGVAGATAVAPPTDPRLAHTAGLGLDKGFLTDPQSAAAAAAALGLTRGDLGNPTAADTTATNPTGGAAVSGSTSLTTDFISRFAAAGGFAGLSGPPDMTTLPTSLTPVPVVEPEAAPASSSQPRPKRRRK
ncbi:CCAAT- binding transcription factor component [Tieghemiomyces parasiticus]|uniref:CCAAT- binding transcription factor component n=1 Tax=Tieghemiomyces parasiticus TaxID=78921 RepID=A0A9W8DXG6_9FUNG|nr:CCAAT- binding transcription factor component [Tieghemiomyces parasiticus]